MFFYGYLFITLLVVVLCFLCFLSGIVFAEYFRPNGDWVRFEEGMIFRKKL